MANGSAGNVLCVVVLAGVLGYCGFLVWGELAPGAPKPAVALVEDQETFFRTPWQTETEFIAASIGEDLVQMVCYVVDRRGASQITLETEVLSEEGDAPIYRAKVNAGDRLLFSTDLVLNDGAWNPQTYAGLARQLLTALKVPTARANPGVDRPGPAIDLQKKLTAGEIQRQNDSLSKTLSLEMTRPELHEHAAMLLGAFALRGPRGMFEESRLTANRATAHLAMASALREVGAPRTQLGVLGLALLDLSVNNQAGALRAAALLSEELAPWRRVIETEVTGDWRNIPPARSNLRFENLAYFRAMAGATASTFAFQQMGETTIDDAADWFRAMGTSGPGVGHVLLKGWLAAELKEVSSIHALYFATELDPKKLVETLNKKPRHSAVTGDPEDFPIRVISWGHWADLAQRHLCAAICENFLFINDRWGNREATPDYLKSVKAIHEGLRLGPFVRRVFAMDDRAHQAAMREAYEVLRKSPELVPPLAWNSLCDFPRFKREVDYPNGVSSHVNEWHKVNPPPGSAPNMRARFNQPSLTGRPDYARKLESLRKVAPYDSRIANAIFARLKGEPSLADLENLYGLKAAYTPHLLVWKSQFLEDQPEAQIEFLREAAAIDPAREYELANALLRLKREPEAAEAFQRLYDRGYDPVLTANSMGWLVNYYAENSRKGDAMRIADYVAEVYSASGLETKAWLMEKIGDTERAELYFGKVKERYEDSSLLAAFYFREYQRTGAVEKFRKCEELVPGMNLEVLRPIQIRELGSDAPRLGVQLASTTNAAYEAGLRKGDVIVAVDGFRTTNKQEYFFARGFSPQTTLHLIVWRDGAYRSLEAFMPGRRFGTGISDYVAKGP